MSRKRSTEPPPPDTARKERVIHTRVPESLEAELRDRAQDLGISVSNLVRNVLGHAFGLVGDVAADAHAIARAARGERTPVGAPARPPEPAEPTLEDVLAWHPIVLGKNAVCARCNELLPRGSDAAIAVSDHAAAARPVICPRCVAALRAAP